MNNTTNHVMLLHSFGRPIASVGVLWRAQSWIANKLAKAVVITAHATHHLSHKTAIFSVGNTKFCFLNT